ncbi:E3 ubiquitin-protein ligase RNF14 [Striga asiatica]|uniref:RBR-type E3 ubiquitin transferase n=1 Tax=Striga asiatica TaxID=4170 RepID=A0A5A7QED8_STRAF|nr:E3 ubiquitin-protein ligase RNF14 [Striga asiatica]
MSSSSRGGRQRRNRNTASHSNDHLEQPSLDRHNKPSTPEPSSISNQNNQGRRAQFRRNSRWAPRNRGGKSHFVNKSEEKVGGDEDEAECSISSSQIYSDAAGEVKVEESDLVGVSGSGLDVGANNGEPEGYRAECERGQETTEGLDSGKEDETLKRLKELSLSVEEPELEEELLAINQQLQEDELLAMESIYGEKLYILENQGGLKRFQVHIHVEVPQGLSITTKFNNSGFVEKGREDISDFSYSFKVEYLPPIILTCLLPKSYPSKCAPKFTIYVQWLEHTKISRLCSELDSIWARNAGQEVIYQWVDWLHNCTLSYLGFDSEILLGPYGVRHDDRQEEMRAISGSASPNIDIPTLKSYNDEKLYEIFCRNIQECSICLSEFAGSEFIKLPCQHFFCEKCLKSFTSINVMDGTVFKIKCPESKCDGIIPPGLIKRLLEEEEFERWESLLLEKTLESMKDVVYCPRCETGCLEDKDHLAQCSKCYYSFCSLCMDKRHVGVECMTPEIKLKVLAERQKSSSMGSDQRRREQAMINDLLSLKEIFASTKRCPNCNLAIVRSEGCNKMVCHNCGQYFCYLCSKAISGYDHFRDGGSCELFPQEEIQRWNERMNVNVVAQFAAFHPNVAHPCPLCGQHNIKMGNNNHIRCWACQSHYCYLCKKKVRRSSEHFGPKGCKQHTAG